MLRSRVLGLALCSATVGASVVLASPVSAAGSGWQGSRTCAPSAAALSFSDALDKVSYQGATVGGLSDLAYDSRSHAWAATVDNHGSDPSRIWFFRDLAHPRVTGVLVLKKPDGTPYDGTT